MIFGYCRISTKSQIGNNSIENQQQEILAEYPDANIYVEQFTGSTNERPVLNDIMNIISNNDTLCVSKLDRLCRNTQEGLKLINELIEKGVKIHILNLGLINDTPVGKMIITQLLAFAEFEKSIIIERMMNGKEIAKNKKDFKEGRPRKYTNKQIDHALELLKNNSYKQVEQLTGISKSTLIRYKKKRD